VGEDPDDPVFVINDLLPHLSANQNRKSRRSHRGGNHALVGSLLSDFRQRKIKPILELLYQKYGLVEEDFTSAELELVPAMKARDVGFDRSLVGSYGQDDRASAYTSLQAVFSIPDPPCTVLALFVDKEEIGSEGSTGAQSLFIEEVVRLLIERSGEAPADSLVKKALARSKAISADVESPDQLPGGS
jgi:aspartyl aminopeptidase